MPLNFLKSLDADDIFISYSRRDGSAYLTGLDAALSKQGFSCFTDKRGTDAGRLPPETLYRKVRSCKTLVLLASPGARERPENITPELENFAEANGTSRIVCVSFDGGRAFADFPDSWQPFVVGKAREREDPGTLTTGAPSEAVVSAVATASDYMKSKDRLRKYRNRALYVLALLVIAIAAAAMLAGVMFKRAAAETARAAQATREAATALSQARAAQAQAQTAQAEADTARVEAAKQKGIADDATRTAEEKTKLADAATLRANEAAERAAAEQARAEREQARAEYEAAVAEVRAGANRSQTHLRLRPEDVSGSLSYAVDASKEAERIGFRSADADAALRESLALLPMQRSRVRLPALSTAQTAISPDGLHYALLDSEVLRVYAFAEGGDAGGAKPLAERPCECSAVALDAGAAHAAAVLAKGGFKIFDLKDDSRSHVFNSFRNVGGEAIVSAVGLALSPNGRYLALNVSEGHNEDLHSALLVCDTERGEPIKIYDHDAAEGDSAEDITRGPTGRLNMRIYDVAFGPTGNLAVGGLSTETAKGRIVIWHLKAGARSKLTADSFRDYEIIPQEGRFTAVAPGADETYFATNKGVWSRPTGQSRFELVARIPTPENYVGTPSDVMLAFRPGGRSIALVRRLAPSTKLGEEDRSFEVWDTSGYTEQAEALQSAEVTHVGFEPGGQLVDTLTDAASQDLKEEPSGRRRSRRLRVYNGETGAEAKSAEPDEGDAFYVSPDAAYFVTLSGDSAHVWDVWAKDGARRKSSADFGGVLDKVNAAAVGRGGRFLALEGPRGGAERIVVYRRDGGAYTQTKQFALGGDFSRNKFSMMALSADGRRLAVHLDSTTPVRIFDDGVENTALRQRLGETDAARMLALSADGRYLAVGESGQARLLDLSVGSWETLLDDKNDAVSCMAFSPDGAYVGVGSGYGLLYVFETARAKGGDGAKNDARVSKEEVARLQHTGFVTAVAFSDNDRYVATASSALRSYHVEEKGYPVRVWLLRPSELIKEAEKRLDRRTPSTR